MISVNNLLSQPVTTLMLGLYLSMPYLSGKLSGHLTLLSDVNRSKARSGITLAIGDDNKPLSRTVVRVLCSSNIGNNFCRRTLVDYIIV